MLKAEGTIIAEESLRSEIDEATASYFFDMLSLLEKTGIISSKRDHHHHHGKEEEAHGHHHEHKSDFAHKHEDVHHDKESTQVERWIRLHRSHHPELAEYSQIENLFRDQFQLVQVSSIHHIYHYLARDVERSERGYAVIEEIIKQEKKKIASGEIKALGRIVVASGKK